MIILTILGLIKLCSLISSSSNWFSNPDPWIHPFSGQDGGVISDDYTSISLNKKYEFQENIHGIYIIGCR